MNESKIEMFEGYLGRSFIVGDRLKQDLWLGTDCGSPEWREANRRVLARVEEAEKAESEADERASAIDEDGDPGRRGLMTEL